MNSHAISSETSSRSASIVKIVALSLGFSIVALSPARADLNVDGTSNGSWNNTGTMTYDTDPTDPTSQTSGQFILNGGGSLTMSGGTLVVTNTAFGVFVGQNPTAGTINMSGGSFTWNANGSNEQRFVFGNSGATGTLTMTGGTFNANTGAGSDTDRGLTFGRSDGSGVANLSGTAVFTSATDRFGMDGQFSGASFNADGGAATSSITLGIGTPQFILNGLADVTAGNFTINTGSFFNFLSGSGGMLKFGTGLPGSNTPVSNAFFNGLVTSGAILINGVAATTSQFSYSVDGNNLGVYQLVPEPSAWLMVVGGLGIIVGFQRFRRRQA